VPCTESAGMENESDDLIDSVERYSGPHQVSAPGRKEGGGDDDSNRHWDKMSSFGFLASSVSQPIRCPNQ
jgi:hypothetical protein